MTSVANRLTPPWRVVGYRAPQPSPAHHTCRQQEVIEASCLSVHTEWQKGAGADPEVQTTPEP